MSLKIGQHTEFSDSAPQFLDGEIYVHLTGRRTGWRAAILLALFVVAAGAGVCSVYATLASVDSSGKFTKATTQCPGMTKEQKATALAQKH